MTSATAAPRRSDLPEQYEALRKPVLDSLAARLRGQGILYDVSDLEDFYNEAWHALYLKLAGGEPVESARGFVAQVAYFRAIDDVRRRHPGRHDDAAEVEETPEPVDLDARLDDEDDLAHLLEGMRGRLSVPERQAAVLCYLQGLSRPEAAAVLGLPEKRMQKLMDGVSRKLAPIVDAIRRGRWCEEQDSLISAYALGVLDPDGERYALATEHLDGCSACRRRVLGMRGVAALVPPVLLPWHVLTGVGALSAAGATAAASGSAAAGGSSTAGAGGGLGAAGTAAATVAAVAVVAAAAVGLTRGGHDTPKAKPTPTPAVAAAVTTPAPPAATTAPQRKAKPAKKKKKAKARPAAVTAAPTAAPTTVATAAPVTTTAPPPVDAGQEFGLGP